MRKQVEYVWLAAAPFLLYLSNMESQQIVDYIRDQLAAGHSEANLRQHMLSNGWPQASADAAFAKYHEGLTAKMAARRAAAKKARWRRRLPDWSFMQWVRRILALAVIVALGIGANMYLSHRQKPLPVTTPAHFSFEQKQTIDATNIGGTVSLYAQANGVLPEKLSVAADGQLAMCSAACDPATTTEVASLLVYAPGDVKMAAYTPGLTVPDTKTMYLVPQAKCASNKALGEASTVARAIVILYARDNNGTTEQRCVTL